jgi:pimeloyl-ACP methyl ester carboxylesterase
MIDLVVVPALGCDARLYDDLFPSLGDFVRLQTVIPDGVTIAACVEQILQAAPERFILMGTSFGGRVTLETALAAPERVVGIIVIGATPGPVADPVAGRRRSERLRGGEFEAVLTEMADMISHLPGARGSEARERFIAMGRTQGAALMARQSDALAGRTDLWSRMREVACPALLLWGREDRFATAAEGLRMAALIPSGRYVEIPECGHFPTIEAPVESAAAIAHWLADNRFASTQTVML